MADKLYNPSEAEQDLLNQITEDWRTALSQKLTSYRHLGDRSVVDFQDISRDLFNGYVEPPTDVDDEWKSRSFRKRIRHKVIAEIAQILSTGFGIDFSAIKNNAINRELSRVCENLYEFSLDHEAKTGMDGEVKLALALFETKVVGTCHVSDEIVWQERTVQTIEDFDTDTMEPKFRTETIVDFKGPKMELVPNGEIYPLDVWEPNIQNQPAVVRRVVMPYSKAEKQYGHYDNFQYVQSGKKNCLLTNDGSENEIMLEDEDFGNEDVEVVIYWNKPEDLMSIVIGKVLLTPTTNPFPYVHKQYPLAKSINETFADVRFYWGNSMPFVSQSEQEDINETWRTILDSFKLKNKPPLFTTSEVLANTDIIRPGAAASFDDTDFRVETINEITKGVGAADFNVLKLAETQMDISTIDPLPSGQSPTGNPTATEVNAIVGANQVMRSFSNLFHVHFLMQLAHLRIMNLLWFVTKDDDFKKVIREGVTVKGNRNGRRVIQFVGLDEMPTLQEVMQAENVAEAIGTPLELVYVDRDSIHDYTYLTRMSVTPKQRKTSGSNFLKAFQEYMVLLNNPLVNQERNVEDLLVAMGKSVEDYMGGQQGQQPQQPMQPPPQQLQPGAQMGMAQQQMSSPV